MSEKKKRNIIIGVLCGVLLLMVVGYAAFNTLLNIEGTTSITSNWDIKITGITSKDIVGKASNKEDPIYEDLTATFKTNLVSPGDSITYDITIENQGNLDAEVARVKLSDPENEAITFETTGISEGDILTASSSHILTVKVTYSDEVTKQPENLEASLTVTLDYVEKGKKSEWTPNDVVYAAEMLKEKVVTSGDGLYEDTYEPGRYIYRGVNPNNYITFNNEQAGWRIMAIESDGSIKLLKNSSIGNGVFDSSGHRQSGFCYYDSNSGCSVYATTTNFDGKTGMNSGGNTGAVIADSTIKTYLEQTYLPILEKNNDKIVYHNAYYGPISYLSDSMTEAIQTEERYSVSTKISLPRYTDFLKTSLLTNCSSYLKGARTNRSICNDSSWMSKDNCMWSISPVIGYYTNPSSAATGVILINCDDAEWPYATHPMFPVVVLDSKILLEGSGAPGDPYKIKN